MIVLAHFKDESLEKMFGSEFGQEGTFVTTQDHHKMNCGLCDNSRAIIYVGF